MPEFTKALDNKVTVSPLMIQRVEMAHVLPYIFEKERLYCQIILLKTSKNSSPLEAHNKE